MNNYTLKHFEVPAPIPYNKSKTYIGIDPGTKNLGFARITPQSVHIYQVSMERNPDPIQRMNDVRDIWRGFQFSMPYNFTVVIEGAAFMSSNYRQVELAEVRAALAIEMSNYGGAKVSIVPPNTIRKRVFGKATIKAHDTWTTLYDVNNFAPIKDCPDALAALSCAYYGVMTDV